MKYPTWITENVLVPVERFITEAREACEEMRRWVEEQVQQPIESWVSRTEQRCREQDCNWWCLCCNKWFCWLVTIVVRVVTWVLVTVGKWVAYLVCKIVVTVVGIVVDLVLKVITRLVTFFVCLFTDPLKALSALWDLFNDIVDAIDDLFGLAVFSSGVHLATYSALLAARGINTRLRGDLDDERCFQEYEMRYRREFGNFYQFLMAFYDMDQEMDSYFWSARKIVNTDERDNEAFVRLVAGRSEVDEPAFYAGQDFFDAREGFGEWMEQALNPAASGRGEPPRRVAGGFDAGDFMAGFTKEIAQLQAQARLGERRGVEAPLHRGGLVPSSDGLEGRAS